MKRKKKLVNPRSQETYWARKMLRLLQAKQYESAWSFLLSRLPRKLLSLAKAPPPAVPPDLGKLKKPGTGGKFFGTVSPVGFKAAMGYWLKHLPASTTHPLQLERDGIMVKRALWFTPGLQTLMEYCAYCRTDKKVGKGAAPTGFMTNRAAYEIPHHMLAPRVARFVLELDHYFQNKGVEERLGSGRPLRMPLDPAEERRFLHD